MQMQCLFLQDSFPEPKNDIDKAHADDRRRQADERGLPGNGLLEQQVEQDHENIDPDHLLDHLSGERFHWRRIKTLLRVIFSV